MLVLSPVRQTTRPSLAADGQYFAAACADDSHVVFLYEAEAEARLQSVLESHKSGCAGLGYNLRVVWL
jgi:hypothetical protein